MRIIPMILAVALFMEQMDSTVIATSLPAIAADIGTSPVSLKLAVTAYLVALAIFIPISGWMSDRFGARNIFRLAILVFATGSVACAFAGSLLRIGVGALPFLLPLMLRIGFGLDAFQSGMITFVTAFGALTSKFVVGWVFRSFGFRHALGMGALLSAAFTAVNATFAPTTPVLLIMASLMLGGVMRSVCFTGVNAMAFADIEDAETAQATVINLVARRISLATGVALAGAVLDISARMHGTGLGLADFHMAFLVVGGGSALSAFFFFALPTDAGASVSGHRRPRASDA